MVSALWLVALMAGPVGAHKPGGGKGGSTYEVLIAGDVTTVDSTGDLSSFITVGNGKGTSLGGDLGKTFLDLVPPSISTHRNFGVCSSPDAETLDDVEWDFRLIRFEKDNLVARFDRHGVYTDDCGFDDYTLRIVFELDENDGPTVDGPRVYTSNGNAHVAIIHYAETDDIDKPKGKKSNSHHHAVGVMNGDLTVTITP